MTKYKLKGLDCAQCAARLETELRKRRRFEFATVDFLGKTLCLDEGAEAAESVMKTVAEIEPAVELVPAWTEDGGAREKPFPWPIAKIALSALLLLAALAAGRRGGSGPGAWTGTAALLIAYALVGWDVLHAAWKNISRGRIFDEMFLMSIASLGAIALGELAEAVGVMLFYSLGEYLQEKAVDSSRKAITSLSSLRPDFARLVSGPRPGIVEPEAVAVGDIVEVRAGERIPLDGEIVEGESFVDTSSLTGEPVPRRQGPGDAVLAGYVNEGSVLRIRAAAPFRASQAARILELVQGAAARKAPAERFLSRFASAYTPFVVIAAVLVAALPPLLAPGEPFSRWLHRALVLLVISCPCALVISVPLGYFGGLGSAARRKILFKGADNLDTILKVKTILFDKTGTLTRGAFEVVGMEAAEGFDTGTVLQLAGRAESLSPHPLAKAIRRAAESASGEGGAEAGEGAVEADEQRGMGVSARVDERQVLVGKEEFLAGKGIRAPERKHSASTEALVAVDGVYAGRILVSDRTRPEARAAIEALRSEGFRRIAMVTGDREEAARSIAEELGIEEVHAGLMPEGKAQVVDEIRASLEPGERLAFVGDGMNDAPVLAMADLGIAMGGLGTDAAIEAADAVIMDDDLGRIAEAVRIAAKTRRIVVQNIAFSLAVKAAFLLLGTAGLASMWEAVIADVGVALAAVLNAVRAAGSLRAFLGSGSRP